jgi:acyl-CoA thioesterase
MSELSELLDALELEEVGEGRYRAGSAPEAKGFIFGGQLLAQSMAAAVKGQPGKEIVTVHSVFARGGDPAVPLDIDVEHILNGRSFGSTTVTLRQKGKVCTRTQILLSAPERDIIRHDAEAPSVAGPDDAIAVGPYGVKGPWEARVVDGISIEETEQALPAQLYAWNRWPDAPSDPVVNQQLLAWSTDPWIIGTSMLPHAGYGQAKAHKEFSTGVLTHTITFHNPVDASDWMLFALEAPHAGNGRVYGRCNIFDTKGLLLASFVQDSMVRHFPGGAADTGHAGVF